MDLNDVEKIDFNALGGADSITVNDLTGTDVNAGQRQSRRHVGGTPATAQVDNVIVNGTNGGNVVDVVGAGTVVSVIGPVGAGAMSPMPKAPTTASSSMASAATTRSPQRRCRPAS